MPRRSRTADALASSEPLRTLILVTSLTMDPAATMIASALALAQERPTELHVADLADHVGYSPFHFSRVFAKHTGIGPGQYLIALRIDAAKRLLLSGDDAVVEVGAAVGFDSLSSFTRRFRTTVGVPPARLRRLAHDISDKPPRPFSLLQLGAGLVQADIALPPGFSPRGGRVDLGGLVPASGAYRTAPFGSAGLENADGPATPVPWCVVPVGLRRAEPGRRTGPAGAVGPDGRRAYRPDHATHPHHPGLLGPGIGPPAAAQHSAEPVHQVIAVQNQGTALSSRTLEPGAQDRTIIPHRTCLA